MTKEDLIPLSELDKIDPARALAIRRKGGQQSTIKKRLARQLEGMKRAGITDLRVQKFLDLIENKEFTALDILKYIHRFLDIAKDDPEKLPLAITKYLEWAKTFHPDKKTQINADTFNAINVNITQAVEEKKVIDVEKTKDGHRLETKQEADQSI